MIRDYAIVGSGFGTFEAAFVRYKTSAPTVIDTHAHNDYLQLLAELGVVGAFGIGLAVMLAFWRTTRAVRRAGSGTAQCFAAASLSAFVAILLHSAVDFNMYVPANGLAFAWLCGTCFGLEFAEDDPSASECR
jgi:O-antigen ligase